MRQAKPSLFAFVTVIDAFEACVKFKDHPLQFTALVRIRRLTGLINVSLFQDKVMKAAVFAGCFDLLGGAAILLIATRITAVDKHPCSRRQWAVLANEMEIVVFIVLSHGFLRVLLVIY